MASFGPASLVPWVLGPVAPAFPGPLFAVGSELGAVDDRELDFNSAAAFYRYLCVKKSN